MQVAATGFRIFEQDRIRILFFRGKLRLKPCSDAAMNIPEDPVKIRVFGTPASAICLH
jgi:hypothetical protein